MTWSVLVASCCDVWLRHVQIKLYEPAILIVGTRGRSLGGFQGLLPGSISKWCLQCSPVPVIVVRPDTERKRIKNKRLNDPTRHGYRDILDKSGLEGGHVLDPSHRNSMIGDPIGDSQAASDAEAAAVAEAIGYKPIEYKGSPLTKVDTTRSDVTSASAYSGRDTSPEDVRSPARVMKSPELRDIDSPELSEGYSDEDAGEESEAEGPLREDADQGQHEPRDGYGTSRQSSVSGTGGLYNPSLTENMRPGASALSALDALVGSGDEGKSKPKRKLARPP